jgi:hypothetical protein
MSIRLVTHCWAMQNPVYAKLLRFHLTSLMDQPVVVSVCYDPADTATVRVLWEFISREYPRLEVHPMPAGDVGRRSIGRNYVALASSEDVLFFTDVDHVFMPGVFEQLGRHLTDAVMVYPRQVMIHRDHATGMRVASLADELPLPRVDGADFVVKRYRRAIGGVQIVRGDFARQHGYLRDFPEWLTTTAAPFADFRDDVKYRKFCQRHGPVRGIELPGIYRMRHLPVVSLEQPQHKGQP